MKRFFSDHENLLILGLIAYAVGVLTAVIVSCVRGVP